MGRRRSSDGGVLLLVLLGAVVAIGQFIAEHLVVVGILAGVGLVVFLLAKFGVSSGAQAGTDETPADSSGSMRRTNSGRFGSRNIDLNRSSPFAVTTRAILNPNGDAYWSADALLYQGQDLRSVGNDAVEPALIDARLPVARDVQDCTVRRLPYWSSYSEASPEARAAFQQWLRTGRKDPGADIGYVFLYFYGLERRAVFDARSSATAAADLQRIIGEVKRLLTIYGEQRSFRGYAGAFLDFLGAKALPAKSYLTAPIGGGSELSFSHRLALAQCAADRQPLPAAWAHLWVTHDRSFPLGTAARRCPKEFEQMFELLYREKYDTGLALPKNRTVLRLDYRPASASFRGAIEGLSIETGLPDVSALSSPVKKLAEIADQACERLARYSRIVGKTPAAAGTFEALVELPIALWPQSYRKRMGAVRDVVTRVGRPAAVPFERFKTWVPEFSELTRGKLRALYSALSGVGLGMEPDVRFGGTTPALDSRVVLFADDADTAAEEPSPKYMAASLTLHLAAAVASADGAAGEAERTLLMKQLQEWLSLTESERRRLQAHLQWLLAEPPKLTGLKKRIEALDISAREAIADFLALVAQADNQVTPEEIRQLQKIFRLLGLDSELVFSKVHTAATEPVSIITEVDNDRSGFAIPQAPPRAPSQSPRGPKPGLALDAAKIAALQKDSERVASILATVFEQQAENSSGLGEPSQGDVKEELPTDDLLGLDAVHSGLLETLLTRTQWTRTELEELAEDREIMLDGALERLNEVCFERFDMALFEDGDPVVLNADAVREVRGVEHQGA